MKGKRFRSTAFLGLGGVAIAILLAAAYTYQRASRTQAAVATSISNSEAGVNAGSEASMANSVAALGRLEPAGKVINLAPNPSTAGARISEVLIEVGDRVAAGEIVATLDHYPQRQAVLAEAQRHVEIAQAKFAQVEAGAKTGELKAQAATIARLKAQNTGELSAQAADIARLEAELLNAEAELQRYQTLYEEGAFSASQLDNRRTITETYRQELLEAQNVLTRIQQAGLEEIRAAEANLERIAEVRPVDLQVAQAEVNGAIASVERAQAELDLSQVKAPIAGQVLQVHVQPGELVTETGIATLGQTDQMYVIAEVHETDINRVQPAQAATISSEYGGFAGELHGVVEHIGLQIHRNSLYDPNPATQSDARVVEVRIRLNPEDSQRVQALTNLQVRAIIQTSSDLREQ